MIRRIIPMQSWIIAMQFWMLEIRPRTLEDVSGRLSNVEMRLPIRFWTVAIRLVTRNWNTSDVLEGAPDCIEVIQNASGCVLNHRDDPKLHRGAFLNHRDDPELHRDDQELIGEDAKPAREDAGTVLDGP